MLMYAAFLYNEYVMPVKQVVLYLGENKTANEAYLGYFDYNYKVIYIKEIPYESFLNDSENLVFAILADFGEDNLKTVLKNIFKVASKYFTNNKNFAELAENIEKLGKLRELENEINILIPTIMPFDIDFRDTPTWRKAQLEEKFATAKAMLIDKMPIAQIAKFTGLTLEQIQALEKEINP